MRIHQFWTDFNYWWGQQSKSPINRGRFVSNHMRAANPNPPFRNFGRNDHISQFNHVHVNPISVFALKRYMPVFWQRFFLTGAIALKRWLQHFRLRKAGWILLLYTDGTGTKKSPDLPTALESSNPEKFRCGIIFANCHLKPANFRSSLVIQLVNLMKNFRRWEVDFRNTGKPHKA